MNVPLPEAILRISPYVPGKPVEETERELGLTGVIKLASNENPLGPSPRAVEAGRRALDRAHIYPDGAAYTLRHELAAHHRVAPEEVVVGNGSNDLIDLFIRAFVHGDDEVLLSAGSFAIFKLAALGLCRKVVELPMARRHYIDIEAIARASHTSKTRLVFLDNPVNPTGTHFGKTALERLMAEANPSTIVVLDEAYFEFATAADYPDSSQLRARYPNLVTLRTFSKIHGLAGLRLGYALIDRELAGVVNRIRPPFNVSAIAQAAGVAALGDLAHQARSRDVAAQGVAFLTRELRGLGFDVPDSQGNFVLCDFGVPAKPVCDALLHEGVIVRPIANYGFPDAARISAGTPAECERLVATLRRLAVR